MRWTVLAVGLVALSGAGRLTAADKKTEPLAAVVAKLREPVKMEAELDTLPLRDILAQIEKEHGLKFVVREAAFKSAGEAAILDKKPGHKQRVTGLRVAAVLDVVLGSLGAEYRVGRDAVEVVPAAEVPAGKRVSAVFKDRPLNEAVAELADDADETVVVAPQTGDARMAFVSAKLVNVPFETALELLAVQADLRVVKRGTAYLVTSPDMANALREEDVQKERMAAEMKLLRSGKLPAPPPEPMPPKPADPGK